MRRTGSEPLRTPSGSNTSTSLQKPPRKQLSTEREQTAYLRGEISRDINSRERKKMVSRRRRLRTSGCLWKRNELRSQSARAALVRSFFHGASTSADSGKITSDFA